MLQSSVQQAVYRVMNEFPDTLAGKCLRVKRKTDFLYAVAKIEQFVRIIGTICRFAQVNRTK